MLISLEVLLKVIGLGWKEYFEQSWNLFDFCIVTICLISVLLIKFLALENLPGVGALPSIRLVRCSCMGFFVCVFFFE